ncbi:ABC transporter [Neobacillus cucumis]|uniref:ABC transporter n=1 Tax=Neobacillus cucumis TaxID=1740721 RepID=A0A2N5H8J8_9BACI|nr:ABC transporter [Neobacillus cucumis]PLS01848.1 ABC transporter [Neobacillus cucumis]
MSQNSSSWALFLGFLTGVFWILSVHLGWIGTALGVIGLGGLIVTVIKFLIVLIGILAFLIFGYYVFKKAWHNRG